MLYLKSSEKYVSFKNSDNKRNQTFNQSMTVPLSLTYYLVFKYKQQCDM